MRRFKLTLAAAPEEQNFLSFEVRGSREWVDTLTLYVPTLIDRLAEAFELDESNARQMAVELATAVAAARHGYDYDGSIVRVTHR
jgi:hypothetical protein